MIQIEADTHLEVLQERLERGADLLFDMELRGETGGEYDRWLQGWMELLQRYESLYAA